MFDSSTILAVASPPGRSARGIIRISGADGFQLLMAHLLLAVEAAPDNPPRQPEPASDEPPVARKSSRRADGEEAAGRAHSAILARGRHFARLTLLASQRFSVSAFVFPAPRSYTGEDTVELQLPGNPALLQRVIDALIASGQSRGMDVRRAEPGEFTARAFFNGRLTLTQAEGVAATIAAQSDAELRAAQLLTSNQLGRLAHELADRLADALALVEAGIDFTDQEDVVAIAPRDLHQRLCILRDRIQTQLDRAVGTEQLQAIPWVVLVGEPNAGKSALFNALLGRERAVVSPTAGTTRDVLAEPLAIETDHGRAEVMLVDLAGLDASDSSIVNRLMQSAAGEAINRAELILRCVPVDSLSLAKREGRGEGCDSTAAKQCAMDELLVRTKRDLLPSPHGRGAGGEGRQQSCDASEPPSAITAALSRRERETASDALNVSAHTGRGLDDLRRAIAQSLSMRAVSLAADALALQPRHEAALRSALDHLEQAIGLVDPVKDQRSLASPELVAAAMRPALDDLANLAGDITPDDILGRVFATFCVGK